jgi:hypothetical protein
VGQLISGIGAPSNPEFATLSVDVLGADVFFYLEVQGLNAFDGNPYVSAVAVAPDDTGSLDTFSGSVNKLVKLTTTNAGSPYAFEFAIGEDGDRLGEGGSLAWTWIGGAGHYQNFALQVEGLAYPEATSAWYSAIIQDEGGGGGDGGGGPSPIPEPESGLMLLAGGLLLASAHRRRKL